MWGGQDVGRGLRGGGRGRREWQVQREGRTHISSWRHRWSYQERVEENLSQGQRLVTLMSLEHRHNIDTTQHRHNTTQTQHNTGHTLNLLSELWVDKLLSRIVRHH